MDGVILLNKPAGMTSFDAVRRCRQIFHEKKTGHTGTLDPNASGLMIVLLGRYTKLLPFCVKDHKVYHAGFSFGMKTDTEDIWGSETERKVPHEHSAEELDEACRKFTGDLMQVPPMYSAVKKDGRKLYELARQGIEIEREARPVTIFSLKCCCTGENTYTMDASVSSGTYIRTLITDFAESLGEFGCMTSLVRCGIEGLSLQDAADFEDLENGRGFIDPLKVIDPAWQIREMTEKEEELIRNGRKLKLDHASDKIIAVRSGRILAAYEKKEDGVYHCTRGLG